MVLAWAVKKPLGLVFGQRVFHTSSFQGPCGPSTGGVKVSEDAQGLPLKGSGGEVAHTGP